MTSEVAVLTKQAVALAADSAVTSGGKIFNTVNKVFALSRCQPVGIMAYGSADVMGVPVETVIKEFRRQQGHESFEHLEGYATRFEEFLAEDSSLFTAEARRGRLCALTETFMDEFQDRAAQKVQQRIRGGQKPNRTTARAALSDAIAEFTERTRSAKRIPIPNATSVRAAVAAEVTKTVDIQIAGLEQLWPFVPLTMQQRIRRLALDQLLREVDFGGQTGFAIAGFGTTDVFPRLRAFEFYCSALSLHKVTKPYSEMDITDQVTSRVVAFAQGDVVTTFMEGIDPRYKPFLENFPATFFDQQEASLLGGANPKPQEAAAVKSAGLEFQKALRKELQDFAEQRFVQPTMEVVAVMPKEELAVLAEALVNLTGLKRKASNYRETVGGPTDVAVISKGDGFVWVKRKHYFDPRLNPDFMARYFQEQDNE
jgi:hypothetical protein